jgi:phasin family protein
MQFPISEFLEEQSRGLSELLQNLTSSRVAAARQAARDSAARIKSLNGRIRALAQSGVRLSAVSQNAVQDIIELQAEIVTSALTEAAAKLERLAYTESVRDLARLQSEVIADARQRIVDDLGRAVTILKDASGAARKAVAPAASATPAAKRKPAARKAKAARKPVAKAKARARKPARKGPARRRKA